MLRRAYGYSEFTIEGETWDCLKKHNPHMPMDGDGWTEEDEKQTEAGKAFGMTCTERREGVPAVKDDFSEQKDEEVTDDPEALRLYLFRKEVL